MNKTQLMFVATCLLLAFSVANGFADTGACGPAGFEVFHINGIHTSPVEANDNFQALTKTLGATYNGEPVNVSLAFNDRRSYSKLEDIASVFAIKAQEYIAVPAETLGRGLLYGGDPELPDSLNQFIADQTIANLNGDGYTAYTDRNLVEIVATIQAATATNKKVLLVPHSQGNLYANAAREALVRSTAMPKPVPGYAIKIFGVASAAGYVSGRTGNDGYLTSGKDIVINGLRLFQPAGKVLPANANPTVSIWPLAPFGHSFIEVYLNRWLEARAQVVKGITDTLSTLRNPTDCDAPAFQVTLTWMTPVDLDLYVSEPSLPVLGAMTHTSLGAGYETYALNEVTRVGQYIAQVRNPSVQDVAATVEVLAPSGKVYTGAVTVAARNVMSLPQPIFSLYYAKSWDGTASYYEQAMF